LDQIRCFEVDQDDNEASDSISGIDGSILDSEAMVKRSIYCTKVFHNYGIIFVGYRASQVI